MSVTIAESRVLCWGFVVFYNFLEDKVLPITVPVEWLLYIVRQTQLFYMEYLKEAN